MALIGEIRKRSILLVVVIVVAMAAFVLGDYLRNRSGAVNADTPITNLYGEGITQTEYQQLLNAELNKYERIYQGMQGEPMPAAVRANVEESFMNKYLNKELYKKQFDAIGLNVTKEEFNDLLQGNHIDAAVYERNGLFLDQNRRFSVDSLRKNLPLILQNNPEFSFFMETLIGEEVESNRYINKYQTLIEKGLYVTKQEAKRQFLNQNSTVSFDYVYKSFSSIADEDVKVEENDIRAYYNAHKAEEKYKQQHAISFQYAEFEILPSEEDKALAREYLENKIELFKNAENDTAFVMTNSDTKDIDFTTKKASDFPSELDSALQAADTNTVIGPYLEGDFYKISKVREVSKQKEATVRHILLGKDKYGDDVAKLKLLADSIIQIIKSKKNFEAMVSEYSTDYASVPNGGVYEWFNEEQMVPEFTKVSFENAIGSISTATTTYGVHIIEVQKRREGKVISVASVDAQVKPSKQTIDKAIDKAIDFRNKFTKENVEDTAFINTARKEGIFVRPASRLLLSQKSLPGFDENVISVQRWGFNSETTVGDISDELVFNKKVIIAHLQKRSKEGTPTFEDVKEEMKYEVVKEKKAALFLDKMKGSSLDAIAKACESNVQTATSVSFNQTNVSGAGNEPKLVGTALAIKPNTISKPVTGNNGIFVVLTKTVNNATVPNGYTFENEQKSAMAGLRGNVSNGVYQALLKSSDMKDRRDEINLLGQ